MNHSLNVIPVAMLQAENSQHHKLANNFPNIRYVKKAYTHKHWREEYEAIRH
jgi:hypothetical protein